MSIAKQFGWLPGARYTNLRDVRTLTKVGFLDIEWKTYDFKRHLSAVQLLRPLVTVARDVEVAAELPRIIDQAWQLAEYCTRVVVVPKDPSLAERLDDCIPGHFLLGYSVPSRYGATSIPPTAFRRPVHLLGGRPDVQRRLAELMPVVSFDCNRFTIDAAFGDYFDGQTFRPHPLGGYYRCIADSLGRINSLWDSYAVQKEFQIAGFR
ncbi:MAG: DUF6610 family protein [Chloroflexota bacterium]